MVSLYSVAPGEIYLDTNTWSKGSQVLACLTRATLPGGDPTLNGDPSDCSWGYLRSHPDTAPSLIRVGYHTACPVELEGSVLIEGAQFSGLSLEKRERGIFQLSKVKGKGFLQVNLVRRADPGQSSKKNLLKE